MITLKDIEIVIPSKGRPQTVKKIFELFPSGKFCISESDVDVYKIKDKKKLLIHPDSLVGLIPKRQWILDNVSKRCVFQTDDDVTDVHALVGRKSRRINDPDGILQIIFNSASICDALGLKLFGYTLTANPMYCLDNRPIGFINIIASSYGIIDREIYYDHNIKSREDVDITLLGLKKFRINWIDTRFCFLAPGWDNSGGLQTVRTQQSEKEDVDYMKKKWGKYVDWKSKVAKSHGDFGSQRSKLNIKVERK